jgi:hypothetical protein
MVKSANKIRNIYEKSLTGAAIALAALAVAAETADAAPGGKFEKYAAKLTQRLRNREPTTSITATR